MSITLRFATRIAAVAAMQAWVAVANAAPPIKSHTKVSTQEGITSAVTDDVFIQVNITIVKSKETKRQRELQLFYQYQNFITNAQGDGLCTIPSNTVTGRVGPRNGELHLHNINTSNLVEGRDCDFKSGGDLTAIDIDLMANGLNVDYSEGIQKRTTNFPHGTRSTLVTRGKRYTLTADARVHVVGADVGTVDGTIGQLSGSAELAVASDVSRSFEVTPGAP